MVIARIPLAAIAGVLCTLAVFFGLWRLVGAPLEVGETVDRVVVDFTRQIVDTPVRPRPRRPKPVREARPETPGTPTLGPGSDERVISARPDLVRISGRTGIGPVRDGGIAIGVDRDALPLVRVNPVYPPLAEKQGIEGWVRVRFSVTGAGTVRDAIVVASEPRGTFDEAALAAVERWRYNPRVDNGVAVERVGLETLFRFTLNDQP